MPVKLETLRLDTLGKMYPQIEALFQKHIGNIRVDMQNRPNDVTPRKLTLDLSFTPVADTDTGDLDEVVVDFSAKHTVPTFKTKTFRLKPTREGLLFNAEIPDQLDQPALPMGDD